MSQLQFNKQINGWGPGEEGLDEAFKPKRHRKGVRARGDRPCTFTLLLLFQGHNADNSQQEEKKKWRDYSATIKPVQREGSKGVWTREEKTEAIGYHKNTVEVKHICWNTSLIWHFLISASKGSSRCWDADTWVLSHSFIQAPLLWQMWSAGGRPGVSGWISDSSITAHLLRQRCWAKHRRLCRLLPSIMHSWPWQPFTELLAHFWLSVPKSFPAMANHVLF